MGMETSTPRAGSQLAPTVARHSAPYGAEPLQVSSRDELAEMAAASQGKDGRSPVAPRGADFPGSGRDGLRASQAQQCPWGGPERRRGGAGGRSSSVARPLPRSGQGQWPGWSRICPRCCLRPGSSAFRPRPRQPRPGDILSLFPEALRHLETKAASLSLWSDFSNTGPASFRVQAASTCAIDGVERVHVVWFLEIAYLVRVLKGRVREKKSL